MKFLKYLSLSLILLLTACGGYPIETNMSQEVADFNFTTQDNGNLGLKDLEGEWWIADFIFTNCTTVCLPMTYNMSQLQTKLKEENLDVKLVSFSVDPEFDSPEVLKKYGESYDADFTNWTFLTGYDFNTIKELSIKSFKSLVVEPKDDDQVMHGTSFFLVSPEGEVIKNYSGTDVKEMDLIVADLKELN